MIELDRVAMDNVEFYQQFGMKNMALLKEKYFELKYMLYLM
jgi:hypothetical protein